MDRDAELDDLAIGPPAPRVATYAGQDRVMLDIMTERRRQDQKWGIQDHEPMEWLSILGEEVGEACKEANENHWSGRDLDNYRKEMIECAAVIVAAIENLDRRRAEC